MDEEEKDLKQAEGTIIGCFFGILIGISMIFGGIVLNILAFLDDTIGIGFHIATVVMFLFCLAIGVKEIKDGVDELKKLK